MSTNLKLRCVTHDPYIQSDDVGSNLSYLPEIRQAYLNRDVLNDAFRVMYDDPDMLWPEFGSSYKNTLRWFLWQHPRCDLELWDEYGRHYPWVEGPEDVPIDFTTPLGTAFDIEDTPAGLVINIKNPTPEGKRLLTRLSKRGDISPMSLNKENR